MKRIFIAVLVFVLLCVISITLFAVVTQTGLWAKELNLYTDSSSKKAIHSVENHLSNALTSNESMDAKPANLSESVYLEVKYFAGISMGYNIYFDPITGESCIEKGLLTDKYYRLPDDYIYQVETNELYVVTNLEKMQSAHISTDLYHKFRNNLTPADSMPEDISNMKKYSVNARLANGSNIEYLMSADFINDKYYVETQSQNYTIAVSDISDILSLNPIFADIAVITQPVPELVITAGHVLVPNLEIIDWLRTKPNGESDLYTSTNTASPYTKMPEPGTLVNLTSKDGSPIPADAEITLNEYHDGELFREYDFINEEVYIPLYEGNLGYTMTARFPEGVVAYEYDIAMELPALVECPYPELRPGDVLAFIVKFSDIDAVFSLKTDIGDFQTVFMPYGEGDDLLALVPINWWTTPGEYSVDVFRTQHQNQALYETFDITILPDDFETTYQQLVVSDELAEKADPVNTANDYVMVRNAKATSSETSYLDGAFILPLEGEFGTSYAQTRYINGENPYRHSGLDIDGDTGDPLVACNDGVVVMAAELVRTGKTVIIDHGMWLFSSYLHMSEFDVEVGDYVEKGELIGKVGSTGFSTGPHLHWSITLNGNYISPLWLVENPVVPQ